LQTSRPEKKGRIFHIQRKKKEGIVSLIARFIVKLRYWRKEKREGQGTAVAPLYVNFSSQKVFMGELHL